MASISLIFLYFYTAYFTRKHCPNQAKKRPRAFSSGACSFLFVRQQIFHALALRRGGLLVGIPKADHAADLLVFRNVQKVNDLLFIKVAGDDRADAALPRDVKGEPKMDVSQAIRTRRSIRKYKQETVPHKVIEEIVADAAYAPSWKNTQIARYILVEDRAAIDKMAEEMVLDFKFNEKTLKSCAALMVLTYITGRSGFERDGSYATPKEAGFEMFDAVIDRYV